MLVEFADDTREDKYLFQLQIAISSKSKDSIKSTLLQIVEQIDNNYGKPVQGIVNSGHTVRHVITPIWDGKKY